MRIFIFWVKGKNPSRMEGKTMTLSPGLFLNLLRDQCEIVLQVFFELDVFSYQINEIHCVKIDEVLKFLVKAFGNSYSMLT
jgi:hypothetical protein